MKVLLYFNDRSQRLRRPTTWDWDQQQWLADSSNVGKRNQHGIALSLNWWFLIMSIDYMILTSTRCFCFDFDSLFLSSSASGLSAVDVKLSLSDFEKKCKNLSLFPPLDKLKTYKSSAVQLTSLFLLSSQKLDHRRQFVVISRFSFLSSISCPFLLRRQMLLRSLPFSCTFSTDCAWQISTISHACN